MAGTSLNLSNLKPPKPPAPVATSPMPKLGKTTAGTGFSPMGGKSATPKVSKPSVKAIPKGKASTAKSSPQLVGGTSTGSGLAGALAQKNLV